LCNCGSHIWGGDNKQLRRHDVETFACVPANPMQSAAARTSAIFGLDHHLDARQVLWKRPAIEATLGASVGSLDRIGRDLLTRATCSTSSSPRNIRFFTRLKKDRIKIALTLFYLEQ
jgi:hypothetical protein